MSSFSFENVTSLRARLLILDAERQDLDARLAQLAQEPNDDELLVHRLRKRKLLLQDRISLIERAITPDTSA